MGQSSGEARVAFRGGVRTKTRAVALGLGRRESVGGMLGRQAARGCRGTGCQPRGVGGGPGAQPGQREHRAATNRSSPVAGAEKRGKEKEAASGHTERVVSGWRGEQQSNRGWQRCLRCGDHAQLC